MDNIKPEPKADESIDKSSIDDADKPKVYIRRFFILFSYILSYFLWNWLGQKYVILNTGMINNI